VLVSFGASSQEYFLLDICTDTRYGILVIGTFRHRGLKRLFHQGDPSKVRADQARRIADLLGHLDRAQRPSDLDLPGYRLHALKGDLKGTWSATISGNWRIMFRFVDGDAFDVDLVDYH
jgi:proteic killer suppression protein